MAAIDITKTEAFKTLPSIKSTDAEWMRWVDLIESKYGANLGKQIFLAKWMKSGSQNANTYAFRDHIKKNYNIEIEESFFNKVVDFGGGVADTFGKIFKVGKITLAIVGGVIVIAVVGTVISAIKSGKSPLAAMKP